MHLSATVTRIINGPRAAVTVPTRSRPDCQWDSDGAATARVQPHHDVGGTGSHGHVTVTPAVTESLTVGPGCQCRVPRCQCPRTPSRDSDDGPAPGHAGVKCKLRVRSHRDHDDRPGVTGSRPGRRDTGTQAGSRSSGGHVTPPGADSEPGFRVKFCLPVAVPELSATEPESSS